MWGLFSDLSYLLNQAYGHPVEKEELATVPLAGGIANQGYQCGQEKMR